MTIKFSDETIRHMVSRFLGWNLPRDFRPDASISYTPGDPRHPGPSGTNLFDATQAEEMVRYMVDGIPANTRDCVEAATATAPFDDMHTPWTSDETNRLKAVLNDAFAPTPEPFQVGKRYRTRGGDIAKICRVNESGDYPVIGTIGGEKYSWGLSGARCVNSLHPHEFDLLPGAIPDAPAENAGGMSDEEIGQRLYAAYDAHVRDGGVSPMSAVARRARELLQPAPTADDPDWYNNLVSMTKSRNEALERAERAEAAIESARKVIERNLRRPTESDWQEGYDSALRMVSEALGLTITPARELTVTWNKDN